jgi:hypothetical protein
METEIKTICPICNTEVIKTRELDREIKTNVICANEFYVHYRDTNGRNVLNKYPEALVSAPENRFAPTDKKKRSTKP